MISKDYIHRPPTGRTFSDSPEPNGFAITTRTQLVPIHNKHISVQESFVRSWWQSRHEDSQLEYRCFTALFSNGEIVKFLALGDGMYATKQLAEPAVWEVPDLAFSIRIEDTQIECTAIVTTDFGAMECRNLANYLLRMERHDGK